MLTPLDDPAWDDLQAALDAPWRYDKALLRRDDPPRGKAVHLVPAAPSAPEPVRRPEKLRPELVNPVPRKQRVDRRDPHGFGYGTRGRPPKKKVNGHAQARGP